MSPDDAYRAAAHRLNDGHDESLFLSYLTDDAKAVLWNRLARERLKVEAERQKNGEIIFAVPAPALSEILDSAVDGESEIISRDEIMRIEQGATLAPPVELAPPIAELASPTPVTTEEPGQILFVSPHPDPPVEFVHVLRITPDGSFYINEKKRDVDLDLLDGLRLFLLCCFPPMLPTKERSLLAASGLGEQRLTESSSGLGFEMYPVKGGNVRCSAPSSAGGRERFVEAMRHLRTISS